MAKRKAEEAASTPSPSPVDNRIAYIESHPILGVTRKAVVSQNAAGDGRVKDTGRTEIAWQ